MKGEKNLRLTGEIQLKLLGRTRKWNNPQNKSELLATVYLHSPITNQSWKEIFFLIGYLKILISPSIKSERQCDVVECWTKIWQTWVPIPTLPEKLTFGQSHNLSLTFPQGCCDCKPWKAERKLLNSFCFGSLQRTNRATFYFCPCKKFSSL